MKKRFVCCLLLPVLCGAVLPVLAQHSRIVAGQTAGLRVVHSAISFGCSPAGLCQELDVNGDGSNDLALITRSISTGSGGVFYVEVAGLRNDTEVAGADSATWGATSVNRGKAIPLALGDSLSDRRLSNGRFVMWKPATATAMSQAYLYFSQVQSPGSGSSSGYWRDTATHYVGLRIKRSDGTFRYGWLRVKGQATVLSYAFQNTLTAVRATQLPYRAIYPNPAANYLLVELLYPHSGYIEVYNSRGQRVLIQSLNSASASNRLDTAGLPKGLYTLRVTTAAGCTSQKFSKS